MRKPKRMLIIFISLILIQLYFTSTASSTDVSYSTGDWTMFRHDPNHSGSTTNNIPVNFGKLQWTYTTGRMVQSSPAVANGYVVIGSRDSQVFGLNVSNGQPLWKYPIRNEVWSSPAIDNGLVYIGADDGGIYSLNLTTGKLFWKSAVGGPIRSSPMIVNGRIYIGSEDNNVYALNASNGATIWSYPTLYPVDSSPAVSDEIVYIAADFDYLYALNASTGKEIWRRYTKSVYSSPSVYNGYVYIGSYDGYVYCLNASTGAKIWEYRTENSVSSSPAVAYGTVYVGSEDNNVYALNATDGQKIWQSPTGYWVRSSPAIADGNVYVGSEDYSIYCFDAFTGDKKWSYETGNSVESSPAIANGNLYVGSDDNRVYAFALYNSTVEDIQLQPSNLAWSTIAFDLIAIAIGLVIIFIAMHFANSNRQIDKIIENKDKTNQVTQGFRHHPDTLCVLAILLFSTIFFINLGRGPLWVADEKTYSQWAFHMVKTGDYVTPWAFGDLTFYIAKPPLIMWLTSLSYQVFGVNNFATRMWIPVFSFLLLVVVFYFGKKLYNRYVGLLGSLVLGTFLTFYDFATHFMTDVPLVFFIAASIYFLFLSENSKENTYRNAVLSGVFFGLALMTKQVQALLIPLIIVPFFLLIRRNVSFLFTKRFALFCGVAVLIFSPWLIYMTARFGSEFWHWYFFYQGFTRTINPLEGHAEGYLFYFSYLANRENLLWVILLPLSAGLCIFNSIKKGSKEDTLILVWMSTVLAVFTFAQTKIYWYILPALPAFAMAISSFLYQLSTKAQEYRHKRQLDPK